MLYTINLGKLHMAIRGQVGNVQKHESHSLGVVVMTVVEDTDRDGVLRYLRTVSLVAEREGENPIPT